MDLRDKLVKQRRDRNSDLVRRMRRGESLMLSSIDDSFFPQRPKVTKDPEAVAKLYKLDPRRPLK